MWFAGWCAKQPSTHMGPSLPLSNPFSRIGPEHEPAVLRERQQFERVHGPLDGGKLAPH